MPSHNPDTTHLTDCSIEGKMEIPCTIKITDHNNIILYNGFLSFRQLLFEQSVGDVFKFS